jgi:hypothetical protein
MNARNLTIGGSLSVLIGGAILRYQDLITDEFLILSALVLFFAAVSYLMSWSATEAYKRLYFKPADWAKPLVKKKIYRCALYSGAGTMLLCGTVFLLADGLTPQERTVVGVFWFLGCVFIGLTSPLLWRFVFDNLMPRLKRWAKGRERGENEALDRPSEVPRE